MRFLVLLTDAFGGHGGIALYNRDFLTALSAHSNCSEVVAIPRLMPNVPGQIPQKITYLVEGIASKTSYVKTVLKVLSYNNNFDLIICSHINLLPIAKLASFWARAPVLLEIYGVDAWTSHKGCLASNLVSRVNTVISISDITRKRFIAWSKFKEDRVFLLPNAIHTEKYGPGEKPKELIEKYNLHGKIVLMTLGRRRLSVLQRILLYLTPKWNSSQ